MLCSRHFYNRIFYANKFCSRTFSSWRNSPIIFVNQFMQFQQNRNTLILFKSRQLQYERSQFCTRNAGNESHLPSIESHLNLDWQFLWLDAYNRKSVKLEIIEGKSSQKFFRIILYKFGKFNNFARILVPQDAYSFVRALDELIVELAKENFEQKLLQIQDPKFPIEFANDDRRTIRPFKLRTVKLTGIIHKFQVELVLFINKERGMMDEICLELTSFNEKTNQRRRLTLPLHALLWLRNQMAELLAKYDGTEQIENEAPVQIPRNFLHTGVFHTAPVPNGVSSVQKLQQRLIRPQSVNNKLASYPKMMTKMQNSYQNDVKNRKWFTPLPVQQKPMKQSAEVKKFDKNSTEQMDPQKAELEEGIRGLFDFDDEEMGKYKRIMAKRKFQSRH